MTQLDRIWDFVRRLSPHARSCLLAELERLDACGVEIPNSADIQAKLRSEFRQERQKRGTPAQLFFAPVEPLLVDGASDNSNVGRIQRGSLPPIWEWISRDLLPSMAREYINTVGDLVVTEKEREAKRVVDTFQTVVIKYLESTLRSPESADQIRLKLASYTASRAAYDDVTKILYALRARGALAKFESALPTSIGKFGDVEVAKISAWLDVFRKKHAEVLPFALTLVANRLKVHWHLIRLATKASRSRNAAALAATPYAITVPMVLDRLEDKGIALRVALKNDRVIEARNLLAGIYDTEYALQMRIDRLYDSEWGTRLRSIMQAIGAMVDAEIARFPDEVGHVLGSRTLRNHHWLGTRLAYLVWKGRDAMSVGKAHFLKLIRAA